MESTEEHLAYFVLGKIEEIRYVGDDGCIRSPNPRISMSRHSHLVPVTAHVNVMVM